jgi:hypothetical protein
MNYDLLFELHKELQLEGRYIHLETILPILDKHKKNNRIEVIGSSVLNQPIHSYEFGNGPIKILMWSQMHGNESTTTKALFDLKLYCKVENVDDSAPCDNRGFSELSFGSYFNSMALNILES